eukprot:scaffold2393_cov267-Pinguiococcus_pyrenoidosus.AAC.23
MRLGSYAAADVMITHAVGVATWPGDWDGGHETEKQSWKRPPPAKSTVTHCSCFSLLGRVSPRCTAACLLRKHFHPREYNPVGGEEATGPSHGSQRHDPPPPSASSPPHSIEDALASQNHQQRHHGKDPEVRVARIPADGLISTRVAGLPHQLLPHGVANSGLDLYQGLSRASNWRVLGADAGLHGGHERDRELLLVLLIRGEHEVADDLLAGVEVVGFGGKRGKPEGALGGWRAEAFGRWKPRREGFAKPDQAQERDAQPHGHCGAFTKLWRPAYPEATELQKHQKTRMRGRIDNMIYIDNGSLACAFVLCFPRLKTDFKTSRGEKAKKRNVHQPGIEPGASRWQRDILPLNHWCGGLCTCTFGESICI